MSFNLKQISYFLLGVTSTSGIIWGINSLVHKDDFIDRNGSEIANNNHQINIPIYDSEGYDKYGYDIKGYDKSGYDSNGYDKYGYDSNGYDLNGYDSNGYDINGYDSHGYDKYGYDSNGYNSRGFDKTGFDKNGFNTYGRDRDGYNRQGYDKEGYNREGIDRYGYNRDMYNVFGVDRAGHCYLYYEGFIPLLKTHCNEATKMLQAGEYRYALFDLRVVLDEALRLLVHHFYGVNYSEDSMLTNLKICEDKKILCDKELIDRLHGARIICNKNNHDISSSDSLTHQKVYFVLIQVMDFLNIVENLILYKNQPSIETSFSTQRG